MTNPALDFFAPIPGGPPIPPTMNVFAACVLSPMTAPPIQDVATSMALAVVTADAFKFIALRDGYPVPDALTRQLSGQTFVDLCFANGVIETLEGEDPTDPYSRIALTFKGTQLVSFHLPVPSSGTPEG